MSEAFIMPPPPEVTTKRAPTVYFIDDSATMREVIKIAFRRENINVITCADAASALAQFEQHRPDVVITDVIMPDQDGYSVCTQIKQHPDFAGIPVVLMSGVVNKSVADKAVAVQADELIRKPFQPQELLGRVKALLAPKQPPAPPVSRERFGSNPLQNLFAPAPTIPVAPAAPPPVPLQTQWEPVASLPLPVPQQHSEIEQQHTHEPAPDQEFELAAEIASEVAAELATEVIAEPTSEFAPELASVVTPAPATDLATEPATEITPEPATEVTPEPAPQAVAEPAWPRALAEAFTPFLPPYSAHPQPPARSQSPAPAAPSANPHSTPQNSHHAPSSAEIAKLRGEILRMQLLVKKLQTELQLEREYNQALESQIRTLNAAD